MSREIVWAPQPGPQMALLQCPVGDVLFGGAKGGGKSDGLLGDFLAHQHQYGKAAHGLLIRRTYKQLGALVMRGNEIFGRSGRSGAGATFSPGDFMWTFPNGAWLKCRHLARISDADEYQGHEHTWVGVDELGNFPEPTAVDLLYATLRSTAGVPCVFRATANPGGAGHAWIKARYIDPAPERRVHSTEIKMRDGTVAKHERLFIRSLLEDNPALMEGDPDYWNNIAIAVAGNDALLEAWRYGNWDIVAGGFFSTVWDRERHVVPIFKRPPFIIPPGWRIDRGFDWGWSAPFAVLWFAESNGEPVEHEGRIYGAVRGDVFVVAEWYGWTGKPNEGSLTLARDIGKGIKRIEADKWEKGRIKPGPADSSIYVAENGPSYADHIAEAGIKFTPADKRPGSRVAGWQSVLRMLDAARKPEPREEPGLFVFDTCTNLIRTLPVLQRDERQADDIDTHSEDHLADVLRYRVNKAPPAVRKRRRHRV